MFYILDSGVRVEFTVFSRAVQSFDFPLSKFLHCGNHPKFTPGGSGGLEGVKG